MRILHLDSSPRGERSHSRRLSREAVDRLVETHPDAEVTYRDLGHALIPPITEEWIAAAFTPEEQRTPENIAQLALSDELIAEVLAAEVIVVGVPMLNFGIPSGLKAWIDQVVRAGKTFSPATWEGLAKGRKVIIGMSAGQEYPSGSPQDFVIPYLRQVFAFIGITDVTVASVATTAGPETVLRTRQAAEQTLSAFAAAA